MTETNRPTVPADDIEALLSDLRQTLLEPNGDFDSDPSFDRVLSQTAAPRAGSIVADALQQLLPQTWPGSMGIARRRALLAAVDKELAERALNSGLIQTVLRSYRQRAKQSLPAVVSALNGYLPRLPDEQNPVIADAEFLRALESGDESVTSPRSVTVLSAWSAMAGVPSKAAQDALEASMRREQQPLSYAAAGAHTDAIDGSRAAEARKRFKEVFAQVTAMKQYAPPNTKE